MTKSVHPRRLVTKRAFIYMQVPMFYGEFTQEWLTAVRELVGLDGYEIAGEYIDHETECLSFGAMLRRLQLVAADVVYTRQIDMLRNRFTGTRASVEAIEQYLGVPVRTVEPFSMF